MPGDRALSPSGQGPLRWGSLVHVDGVSVCPEGLPCGSAPAEVTPLGSLLWPCFGDTLRGSHLLLVSP